MRKLALFLFIGCLVATASSASDNMEKTKLKPQPKTKLVKVEFGRECCTVTIGGAGSPEISATACAGWFLSNSDNAAERACDKARAKLLAAFM
jgi:hypothetical protein